MQQKIKNDIVLLKICINLAKKHFSKTSPNPTVGCIIVKNDEILSAGYTSIGGRPHAEANAINKVEDKSTLDGATMYVSLEPCCHTGQSGPCSDLIIKNKIKRVVIAAIDNDQRVNGKSIETLRKNGIEVDIIELPEAYEINKYFFKARATQKPYVTLKIASSIDGKIALGNDQSKWITSEKSRKYGHYLRYINDGIMIGKNTLTKDNPSLDCRINGLTDNNPIKIIVANQLNFENDYKLFQNDTKVIIIYSDTQENQKNTVKFQKENIELIAIPSKDNLIDLDYALKELNKRSINSILVEGGSVISTLLLKENLIDEINWFKSSKIIGSDGKNAINEMGFDNMDNVIVDFSLVTSKKIDGTDNLLVYRKS